MIRGAWQLAIRPALRQDTRLATVGRRARVVVIGGGVSGLSAASHLRALRPDLELAVLERAKDPGGWLRTIEAEGCTIELGPDSILREGGAIEALARRLGIEHRLVSTRKDRHGAYVVRGGKLARVPDGWSLLSPTDLLSLARADVLSLAGRARAALEPLLPRAETATRESLAAFVRRRFGFEPLERLAQPLAGGIYGADPELLGLEATMPRFVRMEREHGSLVRALGKAATERKTEGARYGLFLAFDGGMQVLIDALRRSVGPGVVTGVEARAVVPADRGTGFVVVTDRANLRADAVVVALPAPLGSKILRGTYEDVSRTLDEIPHGSAATVTFVFRREQVTHALDAYGFVVPSVERRRIIASTWSSEKWPGRAPAGLALLRVFVGDPDEADVVHQDDAALERTALRELRELCGVTGEPLLGRVMRYPNAMPRYTPQHPEIVRRLEATLERTPGLLLAGNSLYGVGIPAAIAAGERAAARASELVARDAGEARA